MNSVGIADLSIHGDMDANKENADSIDDLTANVRGAAITAMAAHVDGSAKTSNKRSPRLRSRAPKAPQHLQLLIGTNDDPPRVTAVPDVQMVRRHVYRTVEDIKVFVAVPIPLLPLHPLDAVGELH